MKLGDYPPQEPLSPMGAAYQHRVLAAGAGIEGAEHAYGADPYQRLAVHAASEPNGDVLVFWHGGGWTGGYKEWMDFMAPALTKRGITFVTAGYRLAPQNLFAAMAEDAASAFAWVESNIAAHGGSPSRLFVGGHSAGGHLAACLAVSAPWRRQHGLPLDAVRGCLPVSGVYRFDGASGLSTRPRFLGAAPEGAADPVAAAASPLLVLDATVAPPFLIAHGNRDFPHLLTQAGQMVEALHCAGVRADTLVLEGDHFDASLAAGDERSGWPARAAAWMHAI